MTSKADENAEKSPEQQGPFQIVDGYNVPRLFEKSCKRPLKEHIDLLKKMELRPDDVLIAAFAKAGTHWIWEVASMLLSGKAEYEKRAKEFAMMEATEIEQMESQPSPRVLNSHLPFALLPSQIREKKIKIVHVYRNVKDVLVSAYFHISQMPDGRPRSFEDIERSMFNPEAPGGNYFTYLKEMDEFRKNNPDVPVFNMSFEDAKEDMGKIVGKLAEFLGVDASAQLCQDIAQATSFKKMKEADKTKDQVASLPSTVMYRKGEVGDWKNYLTVAQSERLDAAMTQLKSCDYHFRYTL